MLLSKQILKNSIRGLNVCMLAGIGTLLITGGILHNNLYASTTIPTNYDISEITSTLYRSVPTGYVKPSYKFKVDPNCTTPSANELSASEAAEIIAQEMYRYFKENISGKTITLYYTSELPNTRAFWRTTIDKDPNNDFYVWIDAITGEVIRIGRDSHLPIHLISNPPKDEEKFIQKGRALGKEIKKTIESNITSNLEKVQDVIIASGFISETIKSVTYDDCSICIQGNDTVAGVTVSPDFKVMTTSNKTYLITLSEDFTQVNSLKILN